MMRRIMAALFAAAVLAGFTVGFGAAPASADGERITIAPWRTDQGTYRTIEGMGFPANAPIRLFVTSPARERMWEIPNDGLMTGPDGSIWFQILPEGGFAHGHLTNGVWTLRVCAGPVCYDLNTFIGGHIHVIPTGLPARICTPFITPHRYFPTFGPPGEAIDPRTGFTFNQIVQYCGPYATPWLEGQFLVPADWYPGHALPHVWPYQTIFPWHQTSFPWDPSVWGALPQFNCIYYLACGYPGYAGPMLPAPGFQTSGYGPIMP